MNQWFMSFSQQLWNMVIKHASACVWLTVSGQVNSLVQLGYTCKFCILLVKLGQASVCCFILVPHAFWLTDTAASTPQLHTPTLDLCVPVCNLPVISKGIN